jgi:hypothetical protein
VESGGDGVPGVWRGFATCHLKCVAAAKRSIDRGGCAAALFGSLAAELLALGGERAFGFCMPRVFQSVTWSIELPDGWAAIAHPDHVEIEVPFPRAQLRVTPYWNEAGHIGPAEWLRMTEDINRKRGRPILRRKCGDFSGYETRFDAGERWIRGWALLADGEGLDVNYRCAIADAGRDDGPVDAALATLRLRVQAT